MRLQQHPNWWRVVLVGVVGLVSCTSSGDTEAASVPVVVTETPTRVQEPTPLPAVVSTPPPPTVAQTETTTSQETATVEPTAEPEPAREPEPAADCVTITDFSTPEANSEWVVVNDNVMGGRSLGDRAFVDETMIFAGSINTNGGGFASLRLPLPPETLVSADRIEVRARADGRNYLLTFDDSVEGRNRRISFRGQLEFTTPGEWETVSVRIADLYAASFGQPVDADPFRPDLATRIGIMLSDGVDGDFTLEVDHIKACR